MKKTITLFVLALTVFFANAQTSKSNWLVGGSILFNSSTEKESDIPGSSTSTLFQLTPDAGYFFIDNLAAGVGVNLISNHSSASNSSGISSTFTIFTAGPFVRYYFGVSPNVKLFVHADASWGSSNENISYPPGSGITVDNQPSIPISMYEGKAGAAFFLNPNVALEFTAGYQSELEKQNSSGTGVPTTNFTTNAIVIGLGFQVYLRSAKSKK